MSNNSHSLLVVVFLPPRRALIQDWDISRDISRSQGYDQCRMSTSSPSSACLHKSLLWTIHSDGISSWQTSLSDMSTRCTMKKVLLRRTFWRSSGELFCKFEFHTEVSSSIRCTLCATVMTSVLATKHSIRRKRTWPLNYSSNIKHIFFVGNDPNAFWWVALQFCKLAHQAAHIWRNRL